MNQASSQSLHAVNEVSTSQGLNTLQRDAPVAEELIDLRQYLVAIARHWPMILGGTFLAGLLATLIAFSVTPSYRATAVLLIEADQRRTVSIEDVIGVDTSKQEYYLTQFELLKSRAIAEVVIDRFALMDNPEFNGQRELTWLDKLRNPVHTLRQLLKGSGLLEYLGVNTAPVPQELDMVALRQRVINNFQSSLIIYPIKKTQLVKIGFSSEDPVLAADVANAVGEAYINNHREARLLATQEANEWLQQRVAVLKGAVSDSESKLTDYLEREGLLDLSGIDSFASSELADLARRLSDARDRKVAAQSLYDVLQDNRNAGLAELSTISEISNHPQLRDVRLAEIEAERLVSELSKRYGPKHDKMIRAQAQLTSVLQRARSVLNDLASGIEKELRSAGKQERAIQAELDAKKSQFHGISVKRASYEALKREVDSNRKLYDLFVNRLKETAATNDYQAAVARLSDRAYQPLHPSSPRKSLMIIVACVVGFGFSVMLALLADSLRNTLVRVSDVQERLRLTPLGSIPRIHGRRYRRQDLSAEIYFDPDNTSFSESLRSIRTSLLLNMALTQRQLIAVTSALPGEGKTTASINLALSVAAMESTLLIDCDLRRPSVGERFKLNQAHPGLANVLAMGEPLDDCIYHHEKSGLDVLAAGMFVSNPQELLGKPRFAELLEQASQRYSKIIIDTPPVAVVSDALIVGQLAKNCVVIVNAGKTKVDKVQRAISTLLNHSVIIDGVILNRQTATEEDSYGYDSYRYQAANSSND